MCVHSATSNKERRNIFSKMQDENKYGNKKAGGGESSGIKIANNKKRMRARRHEGKKNSFLLALFISSLKLGLFFHCIFAVAQARVEKPLMPFFFYFLHTQFAAIFVCRQNFKKISPHSSEDERWRRRGKLWKKIHALFWYLKNRCVATWRNNELESKDFIIFIHTTY